MEELKNLVAEKEVELSEKDEKIQELKKQLENAKKLKPSDDGVVPGNLGIGTVPIPPITIPTTIPATSTVTTTTTAIPTHIGGIPAFLGYPLAYPVQDDDKIIKTNSGHEINLSYWTDLIKLGMAFVQRIRNAIST